MKAKKILSLILALVMIMALCACGGKGVFIAEDEDGVCFAAQLTQYADGTSADLHALDTAAVVVAAGTGECVQKLLNVHVKTSLFQFFFIVA